jgi:hypothetical protein
MFFFHFLLHRTLLRGQNVPLDPNEMMEKERKARARQEYLEDVKKQVSVYICRFKNNNPNEKMLLSFLD